MTATASGPFGGTSVPEKYQSQILASAARWGIPAAILAAQIDTESSFNPNAVSSKGAVGIAQFLPSTAKSIGVDPYNPMAAIDAMARLDAHYLKQFGSIDKALAAYNAGPGAVEEHGGIPPFTETRNYVKKILATAGIAFDGGGIANVSNPNSGTLFGNVSTVLQALTTAAFWRRFGVGVFGVLVIAVGVYFMMTKEGDSMRVARKIEGNIP